MGNLDGFVTACQIAKNAAQAAYDICVDHQDTSEQQAALNQANSANQAAI